MMMTWQKRAAGLMAMALTLVAAAPAMAAGDPTGAAVPADKLAGVGLNFVWVLVAGALVFFMQAGFALVETGFTRAKNATHTMGMNLMVFLVGAIGFWLVGFPLMFGNVGALGTLTGTTVLSGGISIGGWNLIGTRGWLLAGAGYDVAVILLFFFQMVFMDTAVTIPTGSMAERVKFGAVIAGSFFISMLLYPVFGNWVWGGGWLSQVGVKLGLGHGVVDFAGSGVVHTIGGMAALAGAIVLGPRLGKFRKDGTPTAIPGHDLPMGILGTIILFFGWFGFNAGSTLAGSDLRLAVVAVNTMLAGAAGGLAALLYVKQRFGKFDVSMMCNGALAGLVAITAPSAFVNPVAAVFIGTVGGILVVFAALFVERKLKLDDPVGAVAVHGVNGLWGMLALGLFADGTYGAGLNGIEGPVAGLLYGNPGQLAAQLLGVGVAIVWGFGLSFVFYKLYDKFFGLRVSAEDEVAGLDVPEMGALAYPEFVLVHSAESQEEAGEPAVAAGAHVIELTRRTAGVVPSGSIWGRKVEAIIRPERLETVRKALLEMGIGGLTVTEVRGVGEQHGIVETYRGSTMEVALRPKVKIEVVIPEALSRQVIDSILEHARTGAVGDGKVFVYPLEDAIRVRTGERGSTAV
jgi:ammonium transporter, Amt family